MPDTIPRLTVIFPRAPLKERSWIEFLLSGHENIVFCDEASVDDTSARIYVHSSNTRPVAELGRSVVRPGSGAPVGIFHLSDEWFETSSTDYADFDFVIRTYHADEFVRPHVLVVPLGWPNGASRHGLVQTASDRPYPWAFSGSPVSTRASMIKSFSAVPGGLQRLYSPEKGDSPPFSHAEFMDILASSSFCPAPMGNVMLESWRFYEALEAGAIPIVEKRLGFDYYQNLLGPNPVPAFRSWKQASLFVADILKSPERLTELQLEVMAWWRDYKTGLPSQVHDFVMVELSGERRAVAKVPARGRFRISQFTELLKHHDASALLYRIRRLAGRLLSRQRIVAHAAPHKARGS